MPFVAWEPATRHATLASKLILCIMASVQLQAGLHQSWVMTAVSAGHCWAARRRYDLARNPQPDHLQSYSTGYAACTYLEKRGIRRGRTKAGR